MLMKKDGLLKRMNTINGYTYYGVKTLVKTFGLPIQNGHY